MFSMSTVIVVVLLVSIIFLAVSVILGRRTYKVSNVSNSEHVELDGVWIRYRVSGGGPPVLLVHGWLQSSNIWNPLVERLAQRFTVYTIDLKGFGDSDKPLSGYGVRHGSRILYAFAAHFGLTNAAVVGNDIGGVMAIKLAADHPEIVSRLVVVSTPAAGDQIDFPLVLWLVTLPVVGPVVYSLGQLIRPLRALWMRSLVADPEDLTEEVVEDAGKSTPAAVAGSVKVVRRELSGERLIRQARVIKVPALVIVSEEDHIVDPESAVIWRRTISNAEVQIMDGCGHLSMLERPEEFGNLVMTFLTGVREPFKTTADGRDTGGPVAEESVEVTDEGSSAGQPREEGLPGEDAQMRGEEKQSEKDRLSTPHESGETMILPPEQRGYPAPRKDRGEGSRFWDEGGSIKDHGSSEASGLVPEMPDLLAWPERDPKSDVREDRSNKQGPGEGERGN